MSTETFQHRIFQFQQLSEGSSIENNQCLWQIKGSNIMTYFDTIWQLFFFFWTVFLTVSLLGLNFSWGPWEICLWSLALNLCKSKGQWECSSYLLFICHYLSVSSFNYSFLIPFPIFILLRCHNKAHLNYILLLPWQERTFYTARLGNGAIS